MNRGDLIVIGFLLIPVVYHVMREYYAAQRVRHFRKKSGREFTYEPLRHYI